jgi:hypothetical protein
MTIATAAKAEAEAAEVFWREQPPFQKMYTQSPLAPEELEVQTEPTPLRSLLLPLEEALEDLARIQERGSLDTPEGLVGAGALGHLRAPEVLGLLARAMREEQPLTPREAAEVALAQLVQTLLPITAGMVERVSRLLLRVLLHTMAGAGAQLDS